MIFLEFCRLCKQFDAQILNFTTISHACVGIRFQIMIYDIPKVGDPKTKNEHLTFTLGIERVDLISLNIPPTAPGDMYCSVVVVSP